MNFSRWILVFVLLLAGAGRAEACSEGVALSETAYITSAEKQLIVSGHIEEVSSLSTIEKTALTKQYEVWKMCGVTGDIVSGYENIIRTIDDFIPSSGVLLIGNSNKTTTILGRWIPDMQIIKNKLLPNDFNVGTEFGNLSSNIGGFNFLNIPDEIYNTSSDFFNQYNKPWLQQAIERGDDIVLATKHTSVDQVIDPITNELKGCFAEELRFLSQVNYKPINVTAQEWVIIKSWFGY